MTRPFNPLNYPLCLASPSRLTHSEWMQHVPFAMALVDMIRPGVIVELGTYKGVSYCGFCQAAAQLGLSTRAYAVDTWEGDPHNGFNGPEILLELKSFHDPLYGAFSRLVRSSFDDALTKFPDRSIDLLHIDGYHTYDAVRHDFDTWLPKLSERGVILFHDINVRELDFGVWKLWEEIRDQYRSFAFAHQHGLGVLLVGDQCPSALGPLLDATAEDAARIREFFFHLGRQITQRWQTNELEAALAQERHKYAMQLQELEHAQAALQETQAALRDMYRSQATLQEALAYLREQLSKAEQLSLARHSHILDTERLLQAQRAQLTEKDESMRRACALVDYHKAEVDNLRRSLAWRCAHGLSAALRWLAPTGTRRGQALQLGRRSASVLRREGLHALAQKVVRRIRRRRHPQDPTADTAATTSRAA
jgi:hypothetical protein